MNVYMDEESVRIYFLWSMFMNYCTKFEWKVFRDLSVAWDCVLMCLCGQTKYAQCSYKTYKNTVKLKSKKQINQNWATHQALMLKYIAKYAHSHPNNSTKNVNR